MCVGVVVVTGTKMSAGQKIIHASCVHWQVTDSLKITRSLMVGVVSYNIIMARMLKTACCV